MKKNSPLKFLLANGMALLFAASVSGLLAYLTPEGQFLTGLSVFSSVLIAFLYGFGGFTPALVMSVSMLVMGYFTGGGVIAGYLFLIGVLPAGVMIFSSYKGYKFFSQVRNALIAELAAFVLLLALLRLITGQDFSAFFRSIWEEMLEMMPDATKQAFAQLLNDMINPQNTAESMISTEDMLSYISEGMEQTLAIMMPAMLVLYSVINGAVGVLWMNWLRIRHGEDNVKFVPLSGWRLSKQITLGLLIVYIAVLIISQRAGEAGVSAQIIVIFAILAASFIQACASFLSRMRMLGVTSGKRILFLALMLFLSGPFFSLYGILSALFGSKGLFTPKRRFVNPGATPNQQNNQTPDQPESGDDSDDKEEE